MGLEPTTFCLGSIRAFTLWQKAKIARFHAVFPFPPFDRILASYRAYEQMITGPG